MLKCRKCGDSMILFGKILRQLRDERKWSQKQLADKLGISDSQVAHYETEDRLPSLQVLINVSRTFGVTTDFLLGLSSDRNYWLDVSGLQPEEIDLISQLIDSYRNLHEGN